jgi:hypothetical protein
MSYIIKTEGRKSMTLFLVDRSRIKSRWWSYDWKDAMKFNKLSAAKIQASKLMYKNPTVISLSTAIILSEENDRNYDYDVLEHPFSSEALGQA